MNKVQSIREFSEKLLLPLPSSASGWRCLSTADRCSCSDLDVEPGDTHGKNWAYQKPDLPETCKFCTAAAGSPIME
eukprot:scaffold282857_cov21-Tisochrysis_lutea.AAC.1